MRNIFYLILALVMVTGCAKQGSIADLSQDTAAPMASYPVKATPTTADAILIIDAADANRTKRAFLGDATYLGAQNGEIGDVVVWVDGGSCSDTQYTTEATCVAALETWTPAAAIPIDVAGSEIADAGNYYTTDTIEAALQEIGAGGIGGGSDTLGDLSCTTNQIAKWNGTAWACAADATAAGAGYVSTPPTYSDSACTAGQYAFSTTTGYVCVSSGDWNTFALTDWSNLTPDTTPDAFTFTDQTDVAVSTEITSANVQITGLGAASAVTASGGTAAVCTGALLADCGTFGTSPGNITNNQYVAARHTSSASNSTAVNTVVTIGGVSDTFTSTTASGGAGISREGTTYTTLMNNNQSSITDITIPADSTLAVITFSGYAVEEDSFSTGSLTLDSQSATLHVYEEGLASNHVAIYSVSGFTSGANKTLAWDLGGTTAPSGLYISIAYFSGVNTTTPARSTGSEQVTDDGNPSAGTLTAQTGDYAVGIASMYGTGSTVTWTGLTADTFMDAGTANDVGNASYAENSSVSGNLTVSALCSTCSNYASVAAVILQPE